MTARRTSFRLQVISPSEAERASVLTAGDGFKGPFLKGTGSIDLLCGKCFHALAEGMVSGSISNIVLQCPLCESHNAIISIPALEALVGQINALPASEEMLARLKETFVEAREKRHSQTKVIEQVEELAPQLTAFRTLLVPQNSGEFYGLLACVIAFLTWLQSRKQGKQHPSVVINNYFASQDPFMGIRVNDPCPCGSGKKYKKCHGK